MDTLGEKRAQKGVHQAFLVLCPNLGSKTNPFSSNKEDEVKSREKAGCFYLILARGLMPVLTGTQ